MGNVLNKFFLQIGLFYRSGKENHQKSIKNAIQHRPMAAELLDEVFAAIPLEKAFGILKKMPNGLLARNIRKMLKNVEKAFKNNKWNADDCGPGIKISEDGLMVQSFLLDRGGDVRAEMAIPKLNLAAKSIAYFEVEILLKNRGWWCLDGIGFCDKNLPSEDPILARNSLRIWYKYGRWIDGHFIIFNSAGADTDEDFQAGDIIGIGIIHHSAAANSPSKFFAACNGKLLGMVELPAKYASLKLFPTVTLQLGIKIRTNFGQNEWCFNPSQIQ